MVIDKSILDDLTEQAKQSPRLRMNYDLRTSNADTSQRMLNALEPGTVLPIHRHRKSTETVVVLRGSVRQNFYVLTPDPSSQGDGKMIPALEKSVVVKAGGDNFGFSVPVGQWHNTECLESGTIIFEAKDGAYEPAKPEDFWTEG